MVRQFNLAELNHAIVRPTTIRITIDIHTRNIRSHPIRQNLIRQTLTTHHQSMRAAETDTAAILTQAQHATLAALVHNTVPTTALDRLLPAPAEDLVHLPIPALRPAPARPDLVHPAPRLPLPLLPGQALRRTQATIHRPDQATVRRLHLRPRHLPRRRTRAEAVVLHNK